MAAAVLLAVNGTLMRGLALNGNLLAAGARFVREAKTAPGYRLYAIGDAHPAMLKAKGGKAISLELWEVPAAGLVTILQSEPPGLCIGKVMLDDGTGVLGVLGEPWLCEGRTEITAYGGWRKYIGRKK